MIAEALFEIGCYAVLAIIGTGVVYAIATRKR